MKLWSLLPIVMVLSALPAAAPAQSTPPSTPPPPPPGARTYTFPSTRQAPATAYMGFGWAMENDDRPVITEVREGSPAATAGFSVGDVIMAVDGHDTATPGRMFNGATPGRRYTVRLARGDKIIETVIVAAPLPTPR